MLGLMRHLEYHLPSHAHVMKYDHCPGDLAIPVVDGSGRVFNCGFIPVPSNQNTIRGKAYGLVLLNCQLQGIGGGLMRNAVDDLKYLSERMTDCFLLGPSSHLFRNYAQVGHVAQDISAQY